MNFVISRLDNFNIEKGEYKIPVDAILSQNIETLPDVYGSILFPCDEIEASVFFKPKNNCRLNIYALLRRMRFSEDFGNIAYRNIKYSPVICCLFPSNQVEKSILQYPNLLKTFDVFYQKINYNFQAMVIAFSVACWMVKDCCVTSTEFYQFNWFNAYRVRNRIENIYTLSNEVIDSICFDRNEINKAIQLTPLIYGYMLQKKKDPTDISKKFDNCIWRRIVVEKQRSILKNC